MVSYKLAAAIIFNLFTTSSVKCFSFVPSLQHNSLAFTTTSSTSISFLGSSTRCNKSSAVKLSAIYNEEYDDDDDEDEEDEEGEDNDLYNRLAASEFKDTEMGTDESNIDTTTSMSTNVDWGSALGSLRQRVGDIETGKSKLPSQNLFRIMTSDSPNQAISSFVKSANPEVLQSMMTAVSGLLGGLANPMMGIDTVITANGEKIANLCFQLQMTGYMFRNAEYVVALKELMDISTQSKQSYRQAFDALDKDGSGFIEVGEIESLLQGVYDKDNEQSLASGTTGGPPAFEVTTFLKFFDKNKDGRISWEEFEKGLGAMNQTAAAEKIKKSLSSFDTSTLYDTNEQEDEEGDLVDDALNSSSSDDDYDYDDEDEIINFSDPNVSGTIEVELEDGSIIEVQAKDYIQGLKEEAEKLKEALNYEKEQSLADAKRQNNLNQDDGPIPLTPESIFDGGNTAAASGGGGGLGMSSSSQPGGITALIASLGGDIKQLTDGISPEVVDTMKLLVDYVIDGNSGSTSTTSPTSSSSSSSLSSSVMDREKEEKYKKEMELPGSALQQLALWQLILGYRLREAEATGEYKRLLDS